MIYDYENMRMVVYGKESAAFYPVCEKCGRFVKADAEVVVNGFGELKDLPNATCTRCARTKMIFEGYI